MLREDELVGLLVPPRRVRELAALLEPLVTGRVGVSPAVAGVGTADRAYRMARTALRTLTAPGLAVLDDRLPEALLADSPELLPRVLDAGLGGLLALPEAERRVLLDTLAALLDHGGSPTHAAQALFCHRNTVIYRMRRIEAVTGRRIGVPRDRLLLSLGLMAARSVRGTGER
jgi:DNA-binding PucR family transcriptional regulator